VRDGCTIVAHAVGESGPPLVVLHDLAGSSTEFLPTAEALAAHHRVLLIDQRGHGCSTRVPDDLSRQAFIDDAIAQIEAFAREPVTLIGQSMGGNTALLTAHARPELVAHLVMVEAHPDGDAGGMPAHELDAFFRQWPVPFPDRAAAVTALGSSPLAAAWAADMSAGDAGYVPRFDASVMRAAIEPVHESYEREWRALRVPTTVIVGEHGIAAERRATLLEGQPSARLLEVAGAGHDPHVESPEVWLTVLRDALGHGE
jgi:pimeloyl-ACP methyl ester carboxylesterase